MTSLVDAINLGGPPPERIQWTGPDGLLSDLYRRAGEAAKGIAAAAVGAPGDLASLAGASGVPTPVNLIPGLANLVPTTDRIGSMMGADPNSPSFIAGSIGVTPDVMDMARLGKLASLAGMTVFHGTPHRFMPEPDAPFGKFRLDKIGTGEGAQAYGHGIYVAENPEVAKSYQTRMLDTPDAYINKKTGEQINRGGEGYDRLVAQQKRMAMNGASDVFDARWDSSQMPGSFYEVDLPDEQIERMLDWDAPLSEQPEAVREVLSAEAVKAMTDAELLRAFLNSDIAKMMPDIGEVRSARRALESGDAESIADWATTQRRLKNMAYNLFENDSGGAVYGRLASRMGGQAQASEHLRKMGIPGIRYFDGISRTAGEGSRNFVLFDPDIAKITGQR